MKERPILFKPDMVNAVQDGRKTQTRRVIKHKIGFDIVTPWDSNARRTVSWPIAHRDYDGRHEDGYMKCPFGLPGGRLWVREKHFTDGTYVWYEADKCVCEYPDGNIVENVKWKPSIHMFRKHSRINLEITDIRVERLDSISHKDAISEGYPEGIEPNNYGTGSRARDWFAHLWDSINAKKHPWASSPFVWVVTFKHLIRRIEDGEGG